NVEEALTAAEQIGFPAIIKPTDNCSSRGVYVVFDKTELASLFENSIEHSFEQRVLVEQLLTGKEGSAEAIVSAKKVYILGICSKKKSELHLRFDLQLNYPGDYTDQQFKKIRELLDQIVSAYKIEEGIIHVEFVVERENVSLIEFALRGCGSNVITHLIP